MRSPWRAVALAVSVVTAWAPPCIAAGAPPAIEKARQHFERGQRHYNIGDFDAAIGEFKAAYEISPAPGLLFNIAQAYRVKKDRERAIYFYRTFLREDPEASERPFVEARIAELSAEAPPPPASGSPAPAALPGVVVTAPPPSEKDEPGRGLRLAGLISAAGGAALIGTAIVFAVRSSSASDEVSQAFAMRKPWSSHLAEVYADGQRDQTAAWIFGAVGAAAVTTGGALYFLGQRERGTTHVSASVGASSAAVTFRCAF